MDRFSTKNVGSNVVQPLNEFQTSMCARTFYTFTVNDSRDIDKNGMEKRARRSLTSPLNVTLITVRTISVCTLRTHPNSASGRCRDTRHKWEETCGKTFASVLCQLLEKINPTNPREYFNFSHIPSVMVWRLWRHNERSQPNAVFRSWHTRTTGIDS